MRKQLILLACLISISFGKRTEWYTELYTEGNTTVKVPRNEYNEMLEALNGLNDKQNEGAYLIVKANEYKYWENDYKIAGYDSLMSKIDSIDYGQLYKIKEIKDKFDNLKICN